MRDLTILFICPSNIHPGKLGDNFKKTLWKSCESALNDGKSEIRARPIAMLIQLIQVENRSLLQRVPAYFTNLFSSRMWSYSEDNHIAAPASSNG